VLVLSEFAGAAEELREAIIVNAHDITSIAHGIRLAMAMPAEAQARRLRAMRRRVLTFDVHKWATDFLSALTREGASPSAPALQPLADAIAWLRTAAPLAMLLDYDGTLTAIAATPDLAPPDDELHDLLGQLAMRPATRLFLVSGRSREDLDRWFGDLALDLWAEHGTWWRPAAGREWQAMLDLGDRAWLDISREVMEDFAYRTPGAFVEPKSAAIAWHFRKSESGVGSARARELRVALSRALADQPAEILEGKKVIEVRRRGATKAAVVQHLLASDPTPAAILSLGDDRTDEEMFAALPPNAVTIRVGGGPTIAQYRLRDAIATRALLREFV
jgi:trehalose 6-phosphate synthase/phosphatase